MSSTSIQCRVMWGGMPFKSSYVYAKTSLYSLNNYSTFLCYLRIKICIDFHQL
jgi:hypothetical protein